MSSAEWAIYALVDPRDGQIRYVGWTRNVEKRLAGHIKSAPRAKTHKYADVPEVA